MFIVVTICNDSDVSSIVYFQTKYNHRSLKYSKGNLEIHKSLFIQYSFYYEDIPVHSWACQVFGTILGKLLKNRAKFFLFSSFNFLLCFLSLLPSFIFHVYCFLILDAKNTRSYSYFSTNIRDQEILLSKEKKTIISFLIG